MLTALFSMSSTIVETMMVNRKWHGYNGKAVVKAGENYRILLDHIVVNLISDI